MNDYPDDETLKQLENWPHTDIAGVLDCIASAWSEHGEARDWLTAHEQYVVRSNPDERYLRLVTGGWSGNEELIGALQANGLVWMLCWRLSARGGLFIFEYPAQEPSA